MSGLDPSNLTPPRTSWLHKPMVPVNGACINTVTVDRLAAFWWYITVWPGTSAFRASIHPLLQIVLCCLTLLPLLLPRSTLFLSPPFPPFSSSQFFLFSFNPTLPPSLYIFFLLFFCRDIFHLFLHFRLTSVSPQVVEASCVLLT